MRSGPHLRPRSLDHGLSSQGNACGAALALGEGGTPADADQVGMKVWCRGQAYQIDLRDWECVHGCLGIVWLCLACACCDFGWEVG